MKKVSGFIILAIVATLSGCYKETTFDVKPAIEFKELRKMIVFDSFSRIKKDSLILTIKFQDGDGDLGLDTRDSVLRKQGFNYVIKPFRKKKGVFEEFTNNGVPYSGYFIRLKSDGKIGPIEGTLDYSVDFFQNSVAKKDSIKFQVTIKDRAGHLSNTVESSIIILNEF
jgi:hypothetical protein